MPTPRQVSSSRVRAAGDAKRAAVVALLLSGASQRAASEAVGVNRRTVEGWVSEPDVAAALAKARETALADAQQRVGQAAALAVDTLVEIALDKTAPSAARVTAATRLTELAGMEPLQQRPGGGDLALLEDAQLLERLVSLQERLRQLQREREAPRLVEAQAVVVEGSLPSPSTGQAVDSATSVVTVDTSEPGK